MYKLEIVLKRMSGNGRIYKEHFFNDYEYGEEEVLLNVLLDLYLDYPHYTFRCYLEAL